MTSLQGKTVLVTGARAGIGLGISLACADAGANLVLAVRRAGTATELLDRIRRTGSDAVAVECDVARPEEIQAAVDEAVRRFGGLDTFVHNATSPQSSEPVDIEDVTAELWEEHVSVSVRGAYHCARSALPHLQERKGSMLFMTSPAGYEGTDFLPLYAMVKAAQRSFVKSLAREWGSRGVRVNAIMPLAKTPAMENAWRQNPGFEEQLKALVPLGWIGDSRQDIAPAAVYLASENARYVTGQTIVCSGGRFTGL